MNDVKMAFVREVLSRRGDALRNAIIKSIASEGLSAPSEGISSRLNQGNGYAAYEITIPAVRRFQDMGAPLRKTLTAENVLYANAEMLSPKKHKKFPVYNRNVWGHFNSLARELMYGLTDEVVNTIKQQLNS